jgi:hypothetical protein
MFGGGYPGSPGEYGDVYVLSLPSFTWVLVNVPSRIEIIREGHSCAIVGKSQLLSWGGLPTGENLDLKELYASKDPFPQGIGIFDLNTLLWTNNYDADADDYVAHDKVVAA